VVRDVAADRGPEEFVSRTREALMRRPATAAGKKCLGEPVVESANEAKLRPGPLSTGCVRESSDRESSQSSDCSTARNSESH